MTARDKSGKFIAAAAEPVSAEAVWVEPEPKLTADQSIWVNSVIDHIVAGMEPLPVLEVVTGLCEKPIEIDLEGTSLDFICTRPAGHSDGCAPLDTNGNDVLAALETAEQVSSK
ncbi:MAG: hypothetical protein JWO67_4520 [Streptosporangiaceae bacterium]|nr:hypothetical protein [Streptosporangiaceae bacterium]